MPQSAPDTNVTALKVPPHSSEAEMSVLGALLLDGERFIDVMNRISAADFYHREHRLIWEAMADQFNANTPIDAVTLAETLGQKGEGLRTGVAELIMELVETTPGTANLLAYADIVKDRALRRSLIRAGHAMADAAYGPNDEDDAHALIESAEQTVYSISDRELRDGGPQRIGQVVGDTVNLIKELQEHKGKLPGVATGFPDLDRLTNGLHPTDFIVVAGRPAMGKTSFALNIAEYATQEGRVPTAVFSLEMSTEQLVLRTLSSLARIDQNRMRSGTLDDRDWNSLSASIARLRDAPLWIDDTAGITPADLRSRLRRIAKESEEGIGLVVIDYLQLMRLPSRSENRNVEMSQISQSLKGIAKEFRCPVVALSQLNRDVEKRQNKRPVMADLRDSGAIEQDADLIIFIYRDEVYNRESPDAGIAEVIIGKQRNGTTGVVKLQFAGELTQFRALDASHRDDHAGVP